MITLTPIERAVLGTASCGPIDLEQLYRFLQNGPAPVPLADTADAVWSLTGKGLLSPLDCEGEATVDARCLWRARLAPTSAGLEVAEADRPEPPPGWPEGGIYPGMLRGTMPDFTADQIDASREEMLGASRPDRWK